MRATPHRLPVFGAALACGLGVFLLAFYYACRFGLPHHLENPFTLAGVLFFLVLAPDELATRTERFSPLLRAPLLKALFLLAICLSGFLPEIFHSAIRNTIAIAGFACLVPLLREVTGRFEEARWPLITLALSLVMAVTTAGMVWANGYLSPLFLEKLALGTLQPFRFADTDTLFHVTLSNMYRVFGTTSTGLDGVPPVSYHYGSHILMAGLSLLFKVPTIVAYQLLFPVLFIPLILKNTVDLAMSIRDRMGLSSQTGTSRIMALLALAVGFLPTLTGPPGAGYVFGLEVSSCSQVLGTWILLLACEFLVRYVAGHDGELSRLKGNAFLPILYVISPLALSAAMVTKVSVGFSYLGVLCYFVIRMKLYRHRSALIALAIHVGVFALTYFGQAASFPVRYSFLPNFVGYRRVDYLWLILTAFPMGIVYLLVRRFSPAAIPLWKKNYDIDAVLAFILPAVIPLLFINLESGESYVTGIHKWIVIPLMVAAALDLPSWRQRRKALAPRTLFTIVGVLIFHLGLNASSQVYRVHKELSAVRTALATTKTSALPNGRVVTTLLKLGADIPLEEKRRTLIYIPRSNGKFWNTLEDCKVPWWAPTTPFLVPALAGMAMLGGLPRENCAPTNYGYVHYRFNDSRQPASLSNKELCGKVAERGFDQVLVISDFSRPAEIRKCR